MCIGGDCVSDKIYIVKVFNCTIEWTKRVDIEEEVVAVCSNKNRAEEIMKYNYGGVDDGVYKYGMIITVKDGKVYGEIHPIDMKIYEFNEELDIFTPIQDGNDKVVQIMYDRYCYKGGK